MEIGKSLLIALAAIGLGWAFYVGATSRDRHKGVRELTEWASPSAVRHAALAGVRDAAEALAADPVPSAVRGEVDGIRYRALIDIRDSSATVRATAREGSYTAKESIGWLIQVGFERSPDLDVREWSESALPPDVRVGTRIAQSNGYFLSSFDEYVTVISDGDLAD